MKMCRKALCSLLALALLFGICGLSEVNAVESELFDCTQVSCTAVEQLGAAQAVVSVPTAQVPVLNGQEYLDEDAAAAYLSSQMQLRSNTTVVKVKTLGKRENIFYDVIAKALAHTGEPTGGDYLYRHLSQYGGSIGYRYVGNDYYYTLTYEVEYHTTAQQEQEMDGAVDALLEKLDLWNATDYEKVCRIYDYITANISYDYKNLEDITYTLKYSAYAALVNKTAVCQGYASLFYRLALELGVDCRVIAGFGNGGRHAWNIVELNGRYYNLDSTWDASWVQVGLPYNFFLRCEETFEDHIRDEEYETEQFHSAYPMDTADYEPPGTYYGDADGNGVIDGMDATLLLQYAAGWSVQISGSAADANGDGVVDGMDATLLLQYAAGWEVALGAA